MVRFVGAAKSYVEVRFLEGTIRMEVEGGGVMDTKLGRSR